MAIQLVIVTRPHRIHSINVRYCCYTCCMFHGLSVCLSVCVGHTSDPRRSSQTNCEQSSNGVGMSSVVIWIQCTFYFSWFHGSLFLTYQTTIAWFHYTRCSIFETSLTSCAHAFPCILFVLEFCKILLPFKLVMMLIHIFIVLVCCVLMKCLSWSMSALQKVNVFWYVSITNVSM